MEEKQQNNSNSVFSEHPFATVIIGGIILLVILGALFSGSSQQINTSMWKEYADSFISFKYPSDWKIESKNQPGTKTGRSISIWTSHKTLIIDLGVSDVSVEKVYESAKEYSLLEPNSVFNERVLRISGIEAKAFDAISKDSKLPLTIIMLQAQKYHYDFTTVPDISDPYLSRILDTVKIISKTDNAPATAEYSSPKPALSPKPIEPPLVQKESEKPLGISYSQVMNGLSEYFIMEKNDPLYWSGYQSKTSGTMPILAIYGSDQSNITGTGITFFDPEDCTYRCMVKYSGDYSAQRVLNEKILSQYIQNIFPDWLLGTNWVNNVVVSCRSTGNPQSIIKSGKALKVSCGRELGSHHVEIKYNSQPQIDYFQFQQMHATDYVKNPPFYLNKKVKIIGSQIVDFLASGDRGGPNNYILIVDGYNPLALDWIALEISDNNTYQQAISSLNKQDFIVAYGVGEESRSFTTSIGGSSLLPVIKILRLDKCNLEIDATCGNTTVLFKTEY